MVTKRSLSEIWTFVSDQKDFQPTKSTPFSHVRRRHTDEYLGMLPNFSLLLNQTLIINALCEY
jgi:hypothetical protein